MQASGHAIAAEDLLIKHQLEPKVRETTNAAVSADQYVTASTCILGLLKTYLAFESNGRCLRIAHHVAEGLKLGLWDDPSVCKGFYIRTITAPQTQNQSVTGLLQTQPAKPRTSQHGQTWSHWCC